MLTSSLCNSATHRHPPEGERWDFMCHHGNYRNTVTLPARASSPLPPPGHPEGQPGWAAVRARQVLSLLGSLHSWQTR